MWWTYWPTTWVFFAPFMMLACLACMFLMMRAMHGRHRLGPALSDSDLAISRPPVPARFPAGQSAFEEYRAETLRRLDQEQNEFHDFLGRLRTAKDKAEFDQFMAERRARMSSLANTASGGSDDEPHAPAYICPMHASVRQAQPGRCSACGMNLVPESARFKLLRHMFGRPMHVAAMAGIMIVAMAAAMMMMR